MERPPVIARLDRFQDSDPPDASAAPDGGELGGEPFVLHWLTAAGELADEGPLSFLCRMLPELRFPIRAGISKEQDYESKILGRLPRGSVSCGLGLTDPASVEVFFHETGAGLLPILFSPVRADFEKLVQALIHHNEPAPIDPHNGAFFVSGYVNKGRKSALRAAVVNGYLDATCLDPALWKDRFLIIYGGAYSGVSSAELGIDEDVWMLRSKWLRLNHESCHYLVRRLFPEHRFGVQDELVADFAAIVDTLRDFRPDWFRRFLGIAPDQSIGRLEAYRHHLECSDADWEDLRTAVGAICDNFAKVEGKVDPAAWERNRVEIISRLTLAPFSELERIDLMREFEWH